MSQHREDLTFPESFQLALYICCFSLPDASLTGTILVQSITPWPFWFASCPSLFSSESPTSPQICFAFSEVCIAQNKQANKKLTQVFMSAQTTEKSVHSPKINTPFKMTAFGLTFQKRLFNKAVAEIIIIFFFSAFWHLSAGQPGSCSPLTRAPAAAGARPVLMASRSLWSSHQPFPGAVRAAAACWSPGASPA